MKAAIQPVVSATNLCQYFGEGDFRTQVLFDNCIDIHPGQLVIMTGPSGSGKTTLLTLMGALRAVEHGRLNVLGRDMTGLSGPALSLIRREIGFIFQMHNLFDSLTALENVMMSAHVLGIPKDEGRRRAIALLTRLGLGHRIDYKPKALSGGQRQRVAVARALVNRPKLILADEPTAALDKASGQEVVGLLLELTREENASVLMVTHDHRILDAADRVVSMVDGRITSDVLIRQALVICEFLKSVELFSSFNVSELGRIAEKMRVRDYEAGAELIRQGDVGEDFFLLGSGAVEVIIEKNGVAARVAKLETGASFGERALLTGDPRAATIRSLTPCVTYVLSKPDFDAALHSSPDFRTQLQNVFFSR